MSYTSQIWMVKYMNFFIKICRGSIQRINYLHQISSKHSISSLILFAVICVLQISPDGITSRDEKVFRFACEKNIPIIMLTSGASIIEIIILLSSYFRHSNISILLTKKGKRKNKFQLDFLLVVQIPAAPRVL